MSKYQHQKGLFRRMRLKHYYMIHYLNRELRKIRKEKEAIKEKENILRRVTGRPVVMVLSIYYHWLSKFIIFCSALSVNHEFHLITVLLLKVPVVQKALLLSHGAFCSLI